MTTLLIHFGKLIALISRYLNLGHGSTWPGHVALALNKNFIKQTLSKNKHLKIILIAGTNGKTTTGKLIQTILEKSGKRVFQNQAGANLLNGIASSLLQHSNVLSTINHDFAVFEVDENTLPLALKEFTPNYLIILNLFRDQLDRYGEVNIIANRWQKAIKNLKNKTTIILNADDPQVSSLGAQVNPPPKLNSSYTFVFYFGLNDNTLRQTSHQHAVDSTYCPNCNSKLYYNSIYYSHLGDWECKKCKLKRPSLDISTHSIYPLQGVYNRYNIHAAICLADKLGISQNYINSALQEFTPAFGRQEEINVLGKKVKILLSKNPISFNESLRTVANLGAKNVLLVLNDRIPDGRDVSWIWDVDFEVYVPKLNKIVISGDRCLDMALRIKYAGKFSIFNFQFSMKNSNINFQIEGDLSKAISLTLKQLPEDKTLYILPTYSAMLEVRKILTGKKIL